MSRFARRAAAALLAIAASAGAVPLAAQAGAPTAVHPGDAKMYIGTYRNILVIDEATSTVEGEITLKTGIPRSMVLTLDEERFYVLNTMYEDVEVVDIASRSSIRQFTLSSGNRKVRIWGFNVDPQERYAVLAVKTYTKHPDRYEVSEPMLLRYDLQAGAVTDTIAMPPGIPTDRPRLLFSPDGESLYLFGEEIVVLETEGFTEVDRWPYGEALGAGIGRFGFGFPEQVFEEPGYFTGLFDVRDPSQNRRLMGVARVNLQERDVQFFTLGPDESVSFALAPGGRKAYGLHQEVGNYQFWTFDLEGRRVERRESFPGRPRMSLVPSSSGEVLYVYNAGNTIDLYEASTYRHLKTIDLNVDTSTGLFIIRPGRAAAPGGR